MSKKVVVKINKWFTVDLDDLGGANVVRHRMHVDQCDALSDDDIKYFILDHVGIEDILWDNEADTTEYACVEVIDA